MKILALKDCQNVEAPRQQVIALLRSELHPGDAVTIADLLDELARRHGRSARFWSRKVAQAFPDGQPIPQLIGFVKTQTPSGRPAIGRVYYENYTAC